MTTTNVIPKTGNANETHRKRLIESQSRTGLFSQTKNQTHFFQLNQNRQPACLNRK